MTEYLYDRDNPKSVMRQRLTGIEGFFYGVPNINERADMIGRYDYIRIESHFLLQEFYLESNMLLFIFKQSVG